MKVLFLEPFFGGSHKDFALGFKESSEHEVSLLTLPARFWKWRMRGAGLYFAEKAGNIRQYDAVFATSMMDLTDFACLAGRNLPPVLLYFHENQLSYPLSKGEKRDFHLGFTHIISALAADKVLFNSHFHMEDFFTHADALIKRLPDFSPKRAVEQIRRKTEVAYPGCRFDALPEKRKNNFNDPPLIIWNHRWEHDKNPEAFFNALRKMKSRGIEFSLAVLGECFEKSPDVFQKAKKEFKSHLVSFGYAQNRSDYISCLKKGDIVISCAGQENFGISVIEAIRFGCIPLLPARLSYPELIPGKYHSTVLYESEKELSNKLESILSRPRDYFFLKDALSEAVAGFSWQIRVKQYDNILKKLIKH